MYTHTHTIFALHVVLVVPKPRAYTSISLSTQLYSNFNLFFGFVSNGCAVCASGVGAMCSVQPSPSTDAGRRIGLAVAENRKRDGQEAGVATLATVAQKSRGKTAEFD